MTICNMLGMLASHLLWISPIIVGIVAFTSRFIFRLYKIGQPGPFFPIMFVSIGISTNISLDKILPMSLYFMVGVSMAVLMAIILSFLDKRPNSTLYEKIPLKIRLRNDPTVIIDSYFYGTILFFATFLSFNLKIAYPYWVIISCAAILQGDKLEDVISRNFQRILGTIIGVLFTVALLEVNWTILEQMIIISLLYMIVDFLKKRNYAILLIFSTPMALMLSNLIHHQYLGLLIKYRFISIVLGSSLGLVSAWLITIVLNFYKNNSHAIDHIKRNRLK